MIYSIIADKKKSLHHHFGSNAKLIA